MGACRFLHWLPPDDGTGKYSFTKKALVATYARCGGMFNIHLTTNLPRNLPVKKCVNRLRFDRFMVMSLWPRFCPTLYMKVTLSGQRQRLGCTASMFSRRWCTVLKSGQSLSLLLGHLTLLTHGLPAKSFGNRISDTSRTLLPGWPPVSHGIREKRFRFFGHVARADPKQDHHRVIGASLRPPSHWRRSCGRLRTALLRVIDAGLQSVNVEISSAWRKASDRTLWRRIVDTATLHRGARHWRRRRRRRTYLDPAANNCKGIWAYRLSLANRVRFESERTGMPFLSFSAYSCKI